MKRNHKIALGACSFLAIIGIMVSADAVYVRTVKIPDQEAVTSQTHEATTVTQENDGHITIK